MIVVGFFYEDKLKIRKVSSKAIVNSLIISGIFKNPFKEEIPALYGTIKWSFMWTNPSDILSNQLSNIQKRKKRKCK